MRITQILLWVQENKTSERFYTKLGFRVKQSDDNTTIVALEGFDICLQSMRDEELFSRDAMAADKGRGMYLYVYVDNVDATYHRFIGDGLTPVAEPKDWEWGNREFVIKDPDGYKLCFWHPVR